MDTLAKDLTREAVQAVRAVVGSHHHLVPLHRPFIGWKDAEELQRFVETDAVSYAPIQRFEEEIAAACDVRYCVAVSSGSAALQLALMAVGIKAGDQVCIDTLTFAGAAAAIRHVGADPLFNVALGADAAIATHLLGRPHQTWGAIARMPLIIDAAEALGSRWRGIPLASGGAVSILSFNLNKIITTGGGGAVLTQDRGLADYVRHMATTAKVPSDFYFRHDAAGFNFRMGPINAQLGLTQLERLGDILRRKQQTAEHYAQVLRPLGMADVGPGPHETWNHWLNTLRCPAGMRDELMLALQAEGIACRALFTPLHLQEPYRDCVVNMDAAKAAEERFATTILLPSGRMHD